MDHAYFLVGLDPEESKDLQHCGLDIYGIYLKQYLGTHLNNLKHRKVSLKQQSYFLIKNYHCYGPPLPPWLGNVVKQATVYRMSSLSSNATAPTGSVAYTAHDN